MRKFGNPVLDPGVFFSGETTVQDFSTGCSRQDYCCYQHLWQAVLTQLITDARNPASKKDTTKNRKEALLFLLKDSKDFSFVCDLAGINPRRAREHLVKFFTVTD